MCITESLKLFVLYAILFRIYGQSSDYTPFPLSFDLFPGDKQSQIKTTYIGRSAIYDKYQHLFSMFSVELYCTIVINTI